MYNHGYWCATRHKYDQSISPFLSAMSLHGTSKDPNSCPSFLFPSFFIETKSWQKHQSISDSNKLVDFNNINKYFLKTSSQKNLPKKILQKILPKNPPKEILPKRSSQKNPKPPKKIQEKSKKFQNNSSNSSWFWKYPIPYIALGGRKPFRACFFKFLVYFCHLAQLWAKSLRLEAAPIEVESLGCNLQLQKALCCGHFISILCWPSPLLLF